jgi:MFS family permease
MLRTFGRRRWLAAAAGTAASLLVLGLPTDLVPNPVFGRQIEAPAWSYLALVITSVLAGLLLATYVRDEPAAPEELPDTSARADQRRFTVGGLLSFLAIGCPTCNKLVVVALGSSGAISWFEPLQPVLAVAGIGLLAYALRRRVRSEVACELTPSTR